MNKVTISNRFSGQEIFSAEGEEMTIANALMQAAKGGANLYGANLYGADLRGANLRGANLYGADLRGANLYGANLRGANLYGADLCGANLRGANLRGCKIDGEEIKIAPLCVTGLYWWVLVTDGYMRIGCQHHKHAEWAEFSDEQISDMDSHALEFWRAWKSPLLAMCEQQAKAAEVANEQREAA